MFPGHLLHRGCGMVHVLPRWKLFLCDGSDLFLHLFAVSCGLVLLCWIIIMLVLPCGYVQCSRIFVLPILSCWNLLHGRRRILHAVCCRNFLFCGRCDVFVSLRTVCS